MNTKLSVIENDLYDSEYISCYEWNGQFYHARYEGEECKIVIDRWGHPIPVWVCICNALVYQDCCCGAWDLHLRKYILEGESNVSES